MQVFAEQAEGATERSKGVEVVVNKTFSVLLSDWLGSAGGKQENE